ncbi:MAG: NTPase [Candidatus Korarchaeota archaeon]|nr:NTPase [Candidatus Korarchaeota archaeon]
MRKEGKYIIRGRPGSGKSTTVELVRNRLESMGVGVGGIRTPEVREGGVRVGFMVEDIDSDTKGMFASVNYTGGPKISKYTVNIGIFEDIAISALERALAESDVIIIDEIGKMELFSQKFKEVVLKIWESSKVVIATAPVSRIPFVERICEYSKVYWLKRGESGRIANTLIEEITRYLGI